MNDFTQLYSYLVIYPPLFRLSFFHPSLHFTSSVRFHMSTVNGHSHFSHRKASSRTQKNRRTSPAVLLRSGKSPSYQLLTGT